MHEGPIGEQRKLLTLRSPHGHDRAGSGAQKCRAVKASCGLVARVRPHDGDLTRPVEQRLGDGEPPADEPGHARPER